MKILSFDIEITDVIDLKEGQELDDFAPFHISVAATAVHNGEKRWWLTEGETGEPEFNMSQQDAQMMLQYLAEKQREGYMICAWNGLGFDFRWLGFQAGNQALAAEIAMGSYDPMFQFFTARGFPISLASAAKGMGIEQEKLMSGADAPKEWADGEYDLVKEYVMGDCEITNQVVAAIAEQNGVHWITRRGQKKSQRMELEPVAKVLEYPMPDQSWMEAPIPREKFSGWAEELVEDRSR